MTPSRTLRPVFALLAGGLVASCGSADGDSARFERMARRVADIRVDAGPPAHEEGSTVRSAAELGLRPAFSPDPGQPGALKVEVLEPHALWDARDGLRGPFADDAPQPEPARHRAPVAASGPSAPRIEPMPVSAPGLRTTIQLGAYSSPEAARAAWEQAVAGRAHATLKELTPNYVTARVNGKSVVRLRVSAPAAAAAAVCRAIEASDPWCLRGT